MAKAILVGIVAGLTGALLFASIVSGSLLSFVLFYLAPLPLMIASLGWSQSAGIIAALVASSSLAVVFGSWFFLGFLVGIGAPACWLAYLALLARPSGREVATANSASALEWFPVGRLVVWSAFLSAGIVALAIPSFGTDAAAFRLALKDTIDHLLHSGPDVSGEGAVLSTGLLERPRQLDLLVAIIPPAAAVVSTVTSLFNLWLAARIVSMSGRLKRPWPDLKSVELPRFAPVVLGAAVAGTFLPQLPGIVCSLLVCTMLMAYALLGLVVLHQITVGLSGRNFVLGGTYALIAVFAWPLLLTALIGLADCAFDIRGRVAGKRGPTQTPT
jgi:hypothetical protein